MPLLARRRLRRKPQHTEGSHEAQTPPPPSIWRRRRRWLAAIALVLATIIWLPTIIASTPLLHWILAKAAAELEGTITVQSASLGWFSPIRADGVEVRDAQDKPVLRAACLEGDRSLAAMLWNSSKLGQFRIEQPELTILLRNDGSNLEDVLTNYLVPAEEPSDGVNVALEVVDGSVSVADQDSGQTWQIEDLQLRLSLSAEVAGPLKLEASATIADPQRPSRVAVALTLRQHDAKEVTLADDAPTDQPTAEKILASSGEARIEANAVPLTMFQSLVGRFVPRTRLDGRLSSQIHARWGGEGAADKAMLQADVTTSGLMLAMPSLGTDQVQLERLHAACRLTRRDDVLQIERSSLDCDLASLSATAVVELGDAWADHLPASALPQTGNLSGHVDLARLAGMLPDTLRIRKETEVTSGRVQLALSGRPGRQGTVWQGRIEAANLTAVHRGRQLAWQQPILLTLAAHDSPQGLVVENLECQSDFLELQAAGTPESLAASASFNLKQLADQLGQFVDLGGLDLAGNGWAHFNWKRSPEQQFEADAELQLRDFQLAKPQQRPWREENLLVFFSAHGRTESGAVAGLQDASLLVRTSADRIEARLIRPVLDLREGGVWPVHLTMQGQLQHWPARIGTWIAIEDWDLAGRYDFDVEATASTDGMTVRRARLAVGQLHLLGPWLKISEPNVELVVSGGWDRQRRRVQIEPATLTSSSLSLQAGNVTLAVPDDGPMEIAGTVKYQGNLQRLSQWFVDPAAPPTWRMAGELVGTVQLAHCAGLIEAQTEADVGNLTVADSSGEQFHEPLVHLAARGEYEPQDKRLRIDQIELTSATLGGTAAGQITSVADRIDLQLAGEVSYDLEKLTALLRPYIGREIRIGGSGTSRASYRGPLAPAESQAAAGIGWQWANVYGFQVGPGELKATLADGILQVEPLDLAVGQGRLRLAPQVRLAPEPMELTLSPGSMARQIQIDPPMCASLLKYVAPVLAGVTSAEGTFSIELDGCRIPLNDPARGELAGRFTVHSVQIGPGPLVQELAVLLGRAAPARLGRESVVQFRMVQGRVYHEGLELIFPDLTIRTYGSVGLDQTMAVMAEMPIPPKWLGDNPLGSALRNQTIRVPIGGTLDRPRIDRRELEQLSRQFLQDATRNVLRDEMNRQLDRLFAPPQ